MSKLLITTQVYENYGDTSNPHWKAKGGMDYVVKNLPWQTEEDFQQAIKIVVDVQPNIEQDNEYYRESVVGWRVVADDYLTEFELSQQKYDGVITYSPKELAW
jgi:hypothetical protein